MPRQRGSISIIIRRRPPIGPVRLTRFIRRRLTLFLPTLFMMSVGCKGRKVQAHLRWHSTQQMSLRPRRRAVPRLSRVPFRARWLLQTNKAKCRTQNRLLWAQQRTGQMPGWKLPVLIQQLDSQLRPRANQLPKLALSHNNRYPNPPRLAANRRLLRKLSEPRPSRLRLLPTNRTISSSLSKQVQRRNPLWDQRRQTSHHPP